MCGCSGGRMTYGTNSVAGGTMVASGYRPAQQIQYEVTHRDGTVHTFGTDSEAYGDIRKNPGAGMRVVRLSD